MFEIVDVHQTQAIIAEYKENAKLARAWGCLNGFIQANLFYGALMIANFASNKRLKKDKYITLTLFSYD